MAGGWALHGRFAYKSNAFLTRTSLIINKSFIHLPSRSFFTTNFTSIVSWRIDRPGLLNYTPLYKYQQTLKSFKMKNSMIALMLIGAVAARPTTKAIKREVPQEHSHENILIQVNSQLTKDNPDNISDAVFGLLGAKAAAEGAGNIADADCLQQATADQAFTNAKAAGDVDGMTAALIYRALERNTGSVGLKSVPCASIKAVNPEIAALQQHQDPAADGAADLNKQIATELAAQIAAVGGDPALANEASTFAPGKVGDPTGAGNTCDDADDKAGCINSQNLRVDDLSAAEITAASAGGAGAAGSAAGNATAVAPPAANDAGAKKGGKGKANKDKAGAAAGGAANVSADALQQIQAIACAAPAARV
jgi:hypothetical protein